MINLSLIGYLGRDAEIRDAAGKKVVGFSVCVTQAYKNKEGVKVERTTWVECSAWNHEKVAPYLKKGTQVYVSGDPGSNGYLDKEGAAIAYLTLTVNELELLNSKKD